MPKITLSDTQALVILYSGTGTENGRIAYNFGRSTRATFRKLHSLGLIDCPSAGALLTPWGTHVWECLKSEPMRRTFSIGVIETETTISAPKTYPATSNTVIGSGPSGEVTMFADSIATVDEWIESGRFHKHTSKQVPTLASICPCDSYMADDAGFHETGHPETGIAPKEYEVSIIRIHGDEHVHAKGCRDIQRMRNRSGDVPWEMTAKTRCEVAENVWGDIAGNYGDPGSPEYIEELKYNSKPMVYHNCIRELPTGTWDSLSS